MPRTRRHLHPALRSRCAPCSRSSSLYDCAKIQPRGGTFYCDEIDIQETRTKHRKLDSQATLSHRARGRAADGLRSQDSRSPPLRARPAPRAPERVAPMLRCTVQRICTVHMNNINELARSKAEYRPSLLYLVSAYAAACAR